VNAHAAGHGRVVDIGILEGGANLSGGDAADDGWPCAGYA
jgi:hypothetical protein